MVERRVYDDEKHIHFVTFSCDRRRTLLQPDRAKRIVIGQLGSRPARHDGLCTGFVIMPDHVHALARFPEVRQLSPLMNKWKEQTSRQIKESYRTRFLNYWSRIADGDPIWQARYYGFNIWSRRKVASPSERHHRLRATAVRLHEAAADPSHVHHISGRQT